MNISSRKPETKYSFLRIKYEKKMKKYIRPYQTLKSHTTTNTNKLQMMEKRKKKWATFYFF